MKKIKGAFALTVVALVLLANPNFNMIDYFPDCIAYFILYKLIGRRDEIVPYLAETKSALLKLFVTTLVRIPAMAVMYINMSSGRDIVPLFTLVFATVESIFLFSAISNGSRALYYIGERSESDALIAPYKFMGLTVRVENLTAFTYLFVFAKSILNFIPEICNLTFASDKLKLLAKAAYLPLELGCLSAVLILGFIWLLLAAKYVRGIKRSVDIDEVIKSMAGEERLQAFAVEGNVRRILGSLTLVSVSTLFSFDLSFKSSNGMNVLPHFIFGILLLVAVLPLIEQKRYKTISCVGCALYSIFSATLYILSMNFSDKYALIDIAQDTLAAKEYEVITLIATLECLSFLIFIFGVMIGFRRFLLRNTGVKVGSESYSVSAKKHHSELIKKAFGLYSLMMLLTILKCIHINMLGEPEIIYTDSGMVVTTAIPWFGTVVFVASVILVFCSFLFMGELKNEVKLKYGITEH